MEEKYQKYMNFFIEYVPTTENILATKNMLAERPLTEEENRKLASSMKQKNVKSRFKNYVDDLNVMLQTRPKMLNGDTFEEKVDSYEMLVKHVKNTWIKSKELYWAGDYALSVFISILTIEETAKMNFAWLDLLKKEFNNDVKLTDFFNNHKSKLFIGIMSACLVNSRLDRILGLEFITKMLELAESNKGFMNLRNSAVYIDYSEGKIVIPNQAIDKKLSKKLCVLSGEIMAETVGSFPWDWEDLLKEVKDFENKVGLHSESL